MANSRIRQRWLILLAIISFLGHPAWGQTTADSGALPDGSVIEYHKKDNTLTVRVTAVPLRQLLSALSAQTHIQFKPPDPDTTFDDRPVTSSLNRMELERAIRQLLGPSNTAMIYAEKPEADGQNGSIHLAEVKVISLGIIPVTATPSPPSGGAGSGPPMPRTFARPDRMPSSRNSEAQRPPRPPHEPRGQRGGRSSGDSANFGNQQTPNTQGPGPRQQP